MRNFCKHISCLILFFVPFLTHGQALPGGNAAPEIQRGSLPDGILYYLVTNPVQKGFADFALVQRGPRESGESRRLLRELPHFGRRAPYRFLADHGIGYGREGYISRPAGATCFSFPDVPTFDQDVADSTLLLLFDLAASSRKPQAVIVCGDIDVPRIRERMGLLSMMVPTLDDDVPELPYNWTPVDTLTLLYSGRTAGDAAAIHASYSAERLPREAMDSPQPLVSKAYAELLGRMAEKRVRQRFRAAGIPLAAFRHRYRDSAQGPGDECHEMTVYTSERHLGEATRQFATALAALDRDGASPEELSEARRHQIALARRDAARPIGNKACLDRCVASYLYGASPASDGLPGSFIEAHRLDEERELELFNGFVRALLDSARNLTLRFDLPDPEGGADSLRKAFLDGWSEDAGLPAAPRSALSLPALPAGRVRLSADAPEPLSGGRLWTFSNGIKVIYKKTGPAREFRYALMLRGGVPGVSGLQAGESAFVGDMLTLSRVAGMSGADFLDGLDENGISLQAAATLSDLRITGCAPSEQLPLLMQALLALSGPRQPDRAAFEAYRAAEALRIEREALSPANVNALLDSMLRPDYLYPARKRMACLGDDLPERAEAYFAAQFDKVGDGILVLIGDLDEETLKKELCRTLGGFRTQKRYASRPRVESRFATGSLTRTDRAAGPAGGRETGVHIALSTDIPFNPDNYFSFRVAGEVVRTQLAAALAEQGASAELDCRLELFPAERMTLYIHCRPCPEEGLPAGVAPLPPDRLLDAVRTVTHRLEFLTVPEATLKAYKDLIIKQLELRYADPGALIEDVLVRYSEGKDLITDYKAAVQRVSAEGVTRILGRLRDGAEIEYLII